MSNDNEPVHTAELVSSSVWLTVTEVCQLCGVDRSWIVEMVGEGVLEPEGRSEEEWRFAAVNIKRITTARRLARDFELNAPGVALALDLLDEIESLRARLLLLESAGDVGEQG